MFNRNRDRDNDRDNDRNRDNPRNRPSTDLDTQETPVVRPPSGGRHTTEHDDIGRNNKWPGGNGKPSKGGR